MSRKSEQPVLRLPSLKGVMRMFPKFMQPARDDERGSYGYSFDGSLDQVTHPSTAEADEDITVKVEQSWVESTPKGVTVNVFAFLKEVENGRKQLTYQRQSVQANGQNLTFNLRTTYPDRASVDYVVELVLKDAPGQAEWKILDEYFFTVSKPSQQAQFPFPFPFPLPF